MNRSNSRDDAQLNLFGENTILRNEMINPFKVNQIQEKTNEEEKPFIKAHPMSDIYQQLVKGLRKFFERNKFVKAVVGLSGGIDSTLTLKLGIDALGPENITGMIMPELGLTSPINIEHAKKLSQYFKIKYYYVPINSFLMDMNILPWKQNQIARMNTKARVRMCILYNFANTENALVLGTGNKSEIMCGYATKYGDAACDVLVLGDLLKTEVFELARYLELPQEIIDKKPSAELASGQTDEDELGITYKDLDNVLKCMNQGLEEAIQKGISPPLAHKVFNLIEKTEHKRRLPTIIKVKKTLA